MADKKEVTLEQLGEMLKAAVVQGMKEAGEANSMTREQMNEHINGILEDIINPIKSKIDEVHQKQLDALERDNERQKEREQQGKTYKTFGGYLADVVAVEHPRLRDTAQGKESYERLMKAASGLSEGVPSDGGFLVQTDFSTELLRRTYDTAMLPGQCRRIPISSNSNSLKINAVDETSRVNGSRFGGVVAYWENEAGEKTSSKPKFRQIDLKLNKLIGLCYVTDELLEDAAALESVVTQAFQEEFGFKVDDAIVTGTGAGQPLGVLNSPSVIPITAETGQPAATVVAENIIKMRARMWAKSRLNANWWINQDVEQQLHQMSLPVGTGGLPVYLPANGLSGKPYDMLFGRPVVPIEQCQTLGTTGDIILGDLSQYLLVDKNAIQADRSIHVRFVYDETCFRFVYRIDGQPIWNSALTPYHGVNTLSPFITIATRS